MIRSHWQTDVATAIQMRRRIPTNDICAPNEEATYQAQWHSCYRGYFVRRVNDREIDILRINAGAMQHVWTGHFSDIQFHLDLIDIITVQSAVRRRAAQAVLDEAKNAAIRIQQMVRHWISVREVGAMRIKRRKLIRRRKELALAKRMAKRKKVLAATTIQKYWRCYSVRVDFVVTILSAVAIQSRARRYMAACTYQNAVRWVILVQALVRGVAGRKLAQRMKETNAVSAKKHTQGTQVAQGNNENNDTPVEQGTQVAQGMDENKAVPVEQSSHAVGVLAVGALVGLLLHGVSSAMHRRWKDTMLLLSRVTHKGRKWHKETRKQCSSCCTEHQSSASSARNERNQSPPC